MEIDRIRPILIVGAGTIGTQIGFQCAIHDYFVKQIFQIIKKTGQYNFECSQLFFIKSGHNEPSLTKRCSYIHRRNTGFLSTFPANQQLLIQGSEERKSVKTLLTFSKTNLVEVSFFALFPSL